MITHSLTIMLLLIDISSKRRKRTVMSEYFNFAYVNLAFLFESNFAANRVRCTNVSLRQF